MDFARPLVPARLIRRYKRFLADAVLEDGSEVTVHCPNPGAMTGLADPGMRIWLEPARPGARLPFGWRLTELPGGHWAGIDTGVPNRVVAEALAEGRIPDQSGAGEIRREVRYGTEGSRVDFRLGAPEGPGIYVEVKNAHLRRRDDLAEFPDCVTARGAKHMRELSAMVGAGHRAVMLYVVQRTDCTRLALAADLDPAYAGAFAAAREAGVEVLVYGTRIGPCGVTLGQRLPFVAG